MSCLLGAQTRTQGWPAVVKEEFLYVAATAMESRVKRGAVVIEFDRFDAPHVLGVRLSSASLTEQAQNQDQAATQG